MRAFLLACICAILIAFVAAEVVNLFQKPVGVAFATSAVRL
jgi:hypothetical protein